MDYVISASLECDNHKQFVEFMTKLSKEKIVKNLLWDNEGGNHNETKNRKLRTISS